MLLSECRLFAETKKESSAKRHTGDAALSVIVMTLAPVSVYINRFQHFYGVAGKFAYNDDISRLHTACLSSMVEAAAAKCLRFASHYPPNASAEAPLQAKIFPIPRTYIRCIFYKITELFPYLRA